MKLFRKFVTFNVRLGDYTARKFPHFVETQNYKDVILSYVEDFISRHNNSSVLEVGGIDRPLLKRSSKFRYDGIDIEYKAQCEKIYDNFYVQSIEEPIENKYDLIISMTLLEHVRNNDASITQMYKALRPGGYTIHYLPSKYHPYSLALRIVGPKWQRRLVKTLRPWAVDVTGYPAFFDRSSPNEMRKLFNCKGFEYVETISFFRANDYFRFFFPFYIATSLWENICKKLKWEQLCSGFVIIARK